eukprot:Phypoly_transcript_07522.p1 GENE.Phypoly_transcript_07522~~Phypoly_transcript_07522.p1  ORF type:complete len:526 (+),score=71.48 Phypoly_transcript_07522:47-1624(+)
MALEGIPSPILILASIVCILGGGLAAGLTIGLMSLDNVELELLIESGEPKEAEYARKLAPIRKRGNLLLVTLLLTNTVFNELLPLFIDSIHGVSSAVALILPTLTVMIFGEIIPQSFCTRYGLAVGARCVWIVRFLQLIFLPIAFPMAWLLDKVLGEELGNIYSHHQLKGLIELHSHKRHGALTDVETTLLKGALDFSTKRVEEIMVNLQDVFMLDANSRIDAECMARIWQSGRSRIPVCDRDRTNIVGMLFAKDLLVVRSEDALPVRTVLTFYGQPVMKVWSDQKLDSIFTDFKSGKCHLALVQRVNEGTDNKDPFYEPVGIVTLEDVMEALIQDEILDENDEPGGGKHLRPSISSFGQKGKSSRFLPEQVAAIVMYLMRAVEPFGAHNIPEELVTRLVAKCGSTDITENKEGKEVFLYTRGHPTHSFTLILNGKFEILSGDEKLHTEMGPWCFLGLPSLLNPGYKPDYTAKMTSSSAQLLVVSYSDYHELLRLAEQHAPPEPAPSSIVGQSDISVMIDEPLLK